MLPNLRPVNFLEDEIGIRHPVVVVFAGRHTSRYLSVIRKSTLTEPSVLRNRVACSRCGVSVETELPPRSACPVAGFQARLRQADLPGHRDGCAPFARRARTGDLAARPDVPTSSRCRARQSTWHPKIRRTPRPAQSPSCGTNSSRLTCRCAPPTTPPSHQTNLALIAGERAWQAAGLLGDPAGTAAAAFGRSRPQRREQAQGADGHAADRGRDRAAHRRRPFRRGGRAETALTIAIQPTRRLR